MRNAAVGWIILAIMIALDLYVFNVIRSVTQNCSSRTKLFISIIYWLISVSVVIAGILSLKIQIHTNPHSHLRSYIITIVISLFFAKLLAAVFFLTDDLRRLALWTFGKFIPDTGGALAEVNKEGISRSVFLSWAGMAIGGTLFGSFMYGFSNKYRYRVETTRLKFKNLPATFRGLKILQISDIHSGSFTDKHAVNRGVDMILAQNADLILFTGDLVNDRADEMQEYMDVFSRIKAPMGVYSTLGNHDYGDYVTWTSVKAKADNLEQLKNVHAQLGWKLLMNEHVVFERDGEKIALLGIENWGNRAHFPKYGKMNLAYPGTEQIPFKILMSHDPSHWDAEVRPKYADIDLTLSGHTHGMQFGVELPFFKWSPVQWMYKEWAGLYQEGRQYLYVNRGFGFLGYPGRVGILPEITVIELG